MGLSLLLSPLLHGRNYHFILHVSHHIEFRFQGPSINQSSLHSDIPATQDIPVHNLSEPGVLVFDGCRDDGRWLGDVLAEDVALEEVGQPDFGFVAEELLCWDGEDLCR